MNRIMPFPFEDKDSNPIQLNNNIHCISRIPISQQNISNMSVSADVIDKESIPNDFEKQINMNTDDMTESLIIRKTDSDKSTSLNYLANYLRDGTLDDIKVGDPSIHRLNVTEDFDHSEKSIHSQSVSQTQFSRQ